LPVLLPPSALARAGLVLTGAGGVFALGAGATQLRPSGADTALWWPAAALSVGLLLMLPRGRWRWAGVAAIGLAGAAANAAGGQPWSVAICFGAANAAEAAVVGRLMTRRADRPSLVSVRDLGDLLLACTVGALAAGLIAAVSVTWLLDGAFTTTLRSVTASHGSAVLLLVPLMLRTARSVSEARLPERLAQTVCLTLLVLLTFSAGQDLPVPLAPGAMLAWAALRCSTRYVLVQVALTGVAVSAMTVAGWGPLADAGARRDDPLLVITIVQVFLIVLTVVVLAVAASVQERRLALAEVERLALHDTLTGAGNRRLLEDRLAQAVARSERGEPGLLLLLDLDGFKAVNDRHGHQRGDQVLVAVIERRRSVLRPIDDVFRLGGDEFAVLLPGVAFQSDDAEQLCRRVVEAVSAPYPGVTAPVGASLGTAAVRTHTTQDALLEQADRAMYAQKAAAPGAPRRRRAASGPAAARDRSALTRLSRPLWNRCREAKEGAIHPLERASVRCSRARECADHSDADLHRGVTRVMGQLRRRSRSSEDTNGRYIGWSPCTSARKPNTFQSIDVCAPSIRPPRTQTENLPSWGGWPRCSDPRKCQLNGHATIVMLSLGLSDTQSLGITLKRASSAHARPFPQRRLAGPDLQVHLSNREDANERVPIRAGRSGTPLPSLELAMSVELAVRARDGEALQHRHARRLR
jgi:diguanylate cyclase (GGDEF)-like protein